MFLVVNQYRWDKLGLEGLTYHDYTTTDTLEEALKWLNDKEDPQNFAIYRNVALRQVTELVPVTRYTVEYL